VRREDHRRFDVARAGFVAQNIAGHPENTGADADRLDGQDRIVVARLRIGDLLHHVVARAPAHHCPHGDPPWLVIW
jgi:hypothetical protein